MSFSCRGSVSRQHESQNRDRHYRWSKGISASGWRLEIFFVSNTDATALGEFRACGWLQVAGHTKKGASDSAQLPRKQQLFKGTASRGDRSGVAASKLSQLQSAVPWFGAPTQKNNPPTRVGWSFKTGKRSKCWNFVDENGRRGTGFLWEPRRLGKASLSVKQQEELVNLLVQEAPELCNCICVCGWLQKRTSHGWNLKSSRTEEN